jgi:cob(I)alamin adenosyltransferase
MKTEEELQAMINQAYAKGKTDGLAEAIERIKRHLQDKSIALFLAGNDEAARHLRIVGESIKMGPES